MARLFLHVILGCGLLLPALAVQSMGSTGPVLRRNAGVNAASLQANVSGMCDCDTPPITLCFGHYCKHAKPRRSVWDSILLAPKSQCEKYTFVESGARDAPEVCASLGLVATTEKGVSPCVYGCAKECGYKNMGVFGRLCNQRGHDSDSSNSDSNDSSSFGGNGDGYTTWRRGCKKVTLCEIHGCRSCQAPQMLNFDDGFDNACSLFDLPVSDDTTTYYREFTIENGGVFSPWASRCSCTYDSDLAATVSRSKVLTNWNSTAPMVFGRDTPFTPISLFITLSNCPEKLTVCVEISGYKNGSWTAPEQITLETGVPRLFRPSSALCDITKLRFDPVRYGFGLYLDIDNMLLCM